MKYLILGFILLGCSSKEPEKGPIVYSEEGPEVNTTSPKSSSIVVTELNFSKGTTKLNQSQRKELTNLFKEARKKQEIETIQTF